MVDGILGVTEDRDGLIVAPSDVTKQEILDLYDTQFNDDQKNKLVSCMVGLSSTTAVRRNFKNNPDMFITQYEVNNIVNELFNGNRNLLNKVLNKVKYNKLVASGTAATQVPAPVVVSITLKDEITNALKVVAQQIRTISEMEELEEIGEVVKGVQHVIEAQKLLS